MHYLSKIVRTACVCFPAALLVTGMAGSQMRAETLVAASIAQPQPASAVTEFRLDNGIRVVVIPDRRVPVVTHMVWYQVGAADEAEGEHGVAHYLEHMMFKGTAAFPKGEFDRFVTRNGGAHNATTSMDHTVYFQRLPKSALPRIMAMEADRMTGLRIDDADVASERAVVLEEYRRGEVSISSALDKQLRAAIYGKDQRARTTIGTETEIKALTGATAQRFYERFYDPTRATVVIAGDIDEAEARKLTAESYGRVARREGLAGRIPGGLAFEGENQRFQASHPRATSTRVSRSTIAPGGPMMSRRDANAANLFAFVAGGGMTSRLQRILVNEQGKATSTGCSFSYDRGGGLLECAASGRVGIAPEEFEKAFEAAIETLVRDGISDREFDEVKSRFLSTAVYRKDNVYDRAHTYGSMLAEGRSIVDVEAFESDIASLTRAEVQEVGRRILTKGRSVTGILTPPAVASAASTTPTAN